MHFQFFVIIPLFVPFCMLFGPALMAIFSKSSFVFVIRMLQIGPVPTLRSFDAGSLLVICSTVCAALFAMCSTLVKIVSNSVFIFVIGKFEIGSVPILRYFYAISVFGHLYYFLCHLDYPSENIFKNFVHSHSQHNQNKLCTNF